jgi:hypothetical protein
VSAFTYLFNGLNLEFFRVPCLLARKYLFYLLKLRLSGVCKTWGDSRFN